MNATNWLSRALPPSMAAIENRAGVVQVTATCGTGGTCAYCHKPIHPEASAYEVEAYVPAGLRTLLFHRVCLHVWETLPQAVTVDRPLWAAPPVDTVHSNR